MTIARAAPVGVVLAIGAGCEREQPAPVTAEPRVVVARGDLAADESATIELFERSKDAVVYITTTQRVLDLRSRNLFDIPRGTGTGIVWDANGHVVTNNHVVQGAASARVQLNDGRDYAAHLVGASAAHDLAVLRIEVPERPPAPLPIGRSADLKVGQKVFAIGNPFGLDWSLTTGVVSALNRALPADGGTLIQELIQTDAAINPGNSGGPLLDSTGRLIGINTAIVSPSGAYAGVGFAVPVDVVNRVVPQLIAEGKYVRPVLGIHVDQTLSQILSKQLGVKGVAIAGIEPGSPAAEAGLRAARIDPAGGIVPGDIILAVSGQTVETVGELLARLDEKKVGDTVTLTVLREGRKIEVQARLRRVLDPLGETTGVVLRERTQEIGANRRGAGAIDSFDCRMRAARAGNAPGRCAFAATPAVRHTVTLRPARPQDTEKEIHMRPFKVGYFVGSLATASINRKLARALVRLAPSGLEMAEISFRDLPLYSYDYDADFPPAARAFKQALAAVEALLFVTPEYNRSIPGGLKNAIDWASRPYGQNSFTRKPSAVIGTSPGKIGTALAQQSLRGVLSFCNSPQMSAPEAYIQFTPGLITDDGEVTDEVTEKFLRDYVAEFHAFVTRVYTVLPRNP